MNISKTGNESITDYLTNLETNVGLPERFLSALGGGALIMYGIRRGGLGGAIFTLLGSGLAFRGVTGHCHTYGALGFSTDVTADAGRPEKEDSPYHKGQEKIHVTKSVTINKSPAELYTFWRSLENLPKFMSHLESVEVIDDTQSRWKAKAPLGTSVEWNAEITSDVQNERIGWKSIEGSEIPNSGVVEFRPTANRGTEVRVVMTYEPPAGYLGTLIAKLFGEEPNQQVAGDLRRFKQLMESGTITTIEGQTSGRNKDQIDNQTSSHLRARDASA